jgi:hypothetical protein
VWSTGRPARSDLQRDRSCGWSVMNASASACLDGCAGRDSVECPTAGTQTRSSPRLTRRSLCGTQSASTTPQRAPRRGLPAAGEAGSPRVPLHSAPRAAQPASDKTVARTSEGAATAFGSFTRVRSIR